MQKAKIVSLIRINGVWTNQDDIPTELVSKIVEDTLKRAGNAVGLEVTNSSNKTA